MNANKGHETDSKNRYHAARAMKSMVRAFIVFILLAIALEIFAVSVAAANNPGHDSLYILRGGDTITGIFNVTGSMIYNGSQICTSANGFCGQSMSAAGGWTNNSANTSTTLNVGIGTTSPGKTLTVSGTSDLLHGNVRVGDNGNGNNYGIVLTSKDTTTQSWIGNLNISGTGSLQIGYGSTIGTTPVITMNNVNGNIGIGTASPVSLVEIRDNTNNNATAIVNYTGGLTIAGGQGTNNAEYSLLRFSVWGNNGALSSRDGNYIQSITRGNNVHDLAIGSYDSSGSSSEYMRLQQNGNIGIGTTTPSSKLTVAGDINESSGILYTPQICLNGSCQTSWPSGGSSSNSGGWTNTSVNTTTLLNVGIGTTSPQVPLEIYHTSGITERLTKSTGAPYLAFGNSTNNFATIVSVPNGGIQFDTGNDIPSAALNTRMTIDVNGNVGINTTSPQAVLDVNGGVRVEGGSSTCSSTNRG